jgi:chitodextrinase
VLHRYLLLLTFVVFVASGGVASGGAQVVDMSGDVIPPTAPTGLKADSATQTSVTISWQRSTDNYVVAGYEVFQDGYRVGSTSKRSYTLKKLKCGKSYSVAVAAYDRARNRSSQTSVIVATQACPDSVAPSAPTNLSMTSRDGTSISISWSPSTDNVGVIGYDILRAPGTSGGSFSQVGTSSTTSFTNTGLTANTTYRYQVRARDAANNTSGVSSTVTATTQSGTGTGSCSVHIDQWATGYVTYVTVFGPRSGWSFAFALPSGHAFQNGWNAGFTFSGQNVSATNMSYNGTLGSGQSTQWGFQASRPNGNTQLPTIPGCTVV